MACNKCLSFIHDTLYIDIVQSEPFYSDIHWKRLRCLYTFITPLLYKCVCKITHTDTYILEKAIEFNLKTRKFPDDVTKEEVKWFYTYTYMNNTKSPEEVSILLEKLEDSMVSHTIICKIWIGYWVDRLIKVLPSIHLEHTTKKYQLYEPPIHIKLTKSDS